MPFKHALQVEIGIVGYPMLLYAIQDKLLSPKIATLCLALVNNHDCI